MSPGARGEPIFSTTLAAELFWEPLAEACLTTEWQIHAYCLLGNHFHLVLETSRPDIRCRGAPTNTNNMGMHGKLAGPELFRKRFCRLTRLSVLENFNGKLWPGFNVRSSQFSTRPDSFRSRRHSSRRK